MDLGFFSLPMSAGPRDAVVGQDELGRPLRQTVLGQQYGFQAPAPSVPYAQQLATVGQPDNRAQGMRLGDTVVANPDREGLGGADALAAVRGLIEGAAQGITAPARAARGEPVTYGDVAATALDWGLMGAPMAAPKGAIRSTAWNTSPMYHGTPDVRPLQEAGGFAPRTTSVRRIADLDRRNELMAALGDITPGTSAHADVLAQMGDTMEYANVRQPTFFSPDYRMADSYADDTRAFDYQSAEPAVVAAQTNPERVLDVNGRGQNFRGISKDEVRRGLIDAGVPEGQIDTELQRYIFGREDGMMSTDDLAALADGFGFDAVDVSNVKDNYFGGGPAGRVRMMLNSSQILPTTHGLAQIPQPQPSFRAYHGSPHDFDRFSLDHIGTGEGAQAYGHGLYFAENEGVARSYRDNLAGRAADRSEDIGTLGGRAFAELSPDEKHALRMVRAWGDPQAAADAAVRQDRAGEMLGRAGVLNKMASGELPFTLRDGRMYEVQINAGPETFLDWDAPLSQQPEAVRRALDPFNLTTEIQDGMSLMPGARLRIDVDPDLPEYPKYFMQMDSGQEFRLQPGDLQNMIAQNAEEVRGNNIVSTIANQIGGEKAATQALRDAGVPGIRYLDGNSRGAGAGTSNYVVFDDSIIEIIRKYGVAGAAPMLGLTAQQLQNEMDAQGIEG